MRKDPTEFRERFKKWKETGEYELPKFEDGYESFLKTLPDNQKTPGAYNTRRYWELNGKPKNFAEAIGRGMYAIQNDNGILGWHANSVAYNESNDTYEFMKPNYHPTRWMEQVYGYDKSPEFQKDYKVQYNGPMLSDRYVRREKPGLKVKGGQLPKFRLGTEEGTLSTIINAVPWRGYARKAKTLINDAIKLVPGPAGMMTSVPEVNFETKEGLASYGDVVGTATASYGRSYTRPNGWGQQLDKWIDGLKLPNNRTVGNTLALPGPSNTGISNKTFGRGMWGLGTLISLPDMYYDARQLYWDLKTPAEKYAK